MQRAHPSWLGVFIAYTSLYLLSRPSVGISRFGVKRTRCPCTLLSTVRMCSVKRHYILSTQFI